MGVVQKEFHGLVKYSSADQIKWKRNATIGVVRWKTGSLVFTLIDDEWNLGLIISNSLPNPVPLLSVRLNGKSVIKLTCEDTFFLNCYCNKNRPTKVYYKPKESSDLVKLRELRGLVCQFYKKFPKVPKMKSEVNSSPMTPLSAKQPLTINSESSGQNRKLMTPKIAISPSETVKGQDIREFHGVVKYSGIETGSCTWKTGSLVFTVSVSGWKLEVMTVCNTRPAISVKLNESSIIKLICKDSFFLDVKTGRGDVTNVSYKPSKSNQTPAEMVRMRNLHELVNEIKKFSPATTALKSEVGLKSLTLPSSKRTLFSVNGSSERNKKDVMSYVETDSSPDRFTRLTDIKEKGEKENKKQDRIPHLFNGYDDFNFEDSKENEVGGMPKSTENGNVRTPGVENGNSAIGPLGVKFFGSSSTPTHSYHASKRTPDRPWLNGKRHIGLMSDPTPVKKSRLSDAVSYSMKNKSTPQTDQKKSQPLQGFSNLGNTCYMNAILQSLFALDVFAIDLQQLYRKISKSLSFQTLYYALWKLLSNRKTNVPDSVRRDCLRRVKTAISSSAKRFSGYGQHDAHEFLGQVLDQLKEEVNKVGSQTPSPGVKEPNSSPENVRNSMINPTSRSFEFEVLHTITCVDCLEEVTKVEQFFDVSIDLPKRRSMTTPSSLQDAVNLYFHNETIDYTCDKCRSTRAEVSHKFSRLPRVLILHLKRYRYNQAVLRHTKLGGNVAVPLYITLQSHCEQETQPPFPASLEPVFSGADRFTFKKKDPSTLEGSGDTDKSRNEDEDEDIKLMPLEEEDEDAELARAIELSLKEQKDKDQYNGEYGGTSDSDFQRALEISLQECYHQDTWMNISEDKENEVLLMEETSGAVNSFDKVTKPLQVERDHKIPLQEKPVLTDPQAADVFDTSSSFEETEQFEVNLPEVKNEKGELPYSYRLVSIVSHIGTSSSTGHYVSDVYDLKKKVWHSYDDSRVGRTTEEQVRSSREQTGYIFFYMEKNVFEDICDNHSLAGSKPEDHKTSS